jgi:hypothetical protein
VSTNPSELCRIEVVATHNPFAFFYDLFTPTITVDGDSQRRPWGVYLYDLPPGAHRVSVSYPWAFMKECGKNTVEITLRRGESRRVTYCARLIRYLPGKMTVE